MVKCFNVFLPDFRVHFTNEQMAIVCLLCTLLAVLPNSIHLLFNARKEAFILSLINTSLAFFLFSFQVNIVIFLSFKCFDSFCYVNEPSTFDDIFLGP